MICKLVRDLDAIVQSTNDRLLWARSMCRLALFFSRQGEIARATEAINAVRASFENALGPEVAAWLMLAEGVQHFSQGDIDRSVDRIKRAYAIASASNGAGAKPTCGAWLAHMALNTRRFSDIASLIHEVLTQATADDHQARARASLVLADTFHFAGRFDLARPWYEKARIHATNEGDEAAVSAMLHNVAAFRTANVRLADALGTSLPDESRRASMEAASATAYDRAIGTKSFSEFLPHVSEQLLIVEKKYQDALVKLASIDVDGLPSRVHAVHHVDYATCALEGGDRALAAKLCGSAIASLGKFQMDPDDVAYVCCRLASIYAAIGEASSAVAFQAQAVTAIERHRSIQLELCSMLMGVVASLEPA